MITSVARCLVHATATRWYCGKLDEPVTGWKGGGAGCIAAAQTADDQMRNVMDETAGFERDLFNLLSGSFVRVVGRPLVASGRNSSWLYAGAPFAVLAHNTEPDPRFIYANRTAQRLFEYDWEEFTNVPSRLSLPPVNRAERSGLLDEVSRNGFIDDYSGIRVAKSGRLFRIEQAVVWQLLDQHGRVRGQGATFGSWREVDA